MKNVAVNERITITKYKIYTPKIYKRTKCVFKATENITINNNNNDDHHSIIWYEIKILNERHQHFVAFFSLLLFYFSVYDFCCLLFYFYLLFLDKKFVFSNTCWGFFFFTYITLIRLSSVTHSMIWEKTYLSVYCFDVKAVILQMEGWYCLPFIFLLQSLFFCVEDTIWWWWSQINFLWQLNLSKCWQGERWIFTFLWNTHFSSKEILKGGSFFLHKTTMNLYNLYRAHPHNYN